ncbi:MAG: flagellar basal body protein FliL [Deltaproteobacteria bacterium]|nr:flagellar basal body protein FliL [Deltaproteobacteria bacterium]
MSTAATSAEGVAGAAEREKKKGSKLPLILGLVVLLAGGGAAAWHFGLLPFGGDAPPDAEHAEEGHGAAAEGGDHGAAAGEHGKPAAKAKGSHGGGGGHGAAGDAGGMRPLDPFLANLADENTSRYLKLSLQVEFVDSEPPAAFDTRLPQIRDVILTLVTSKTFADIRTAEGKERLREDVIDRINHVLAQDAVKSIYFTEFIVQ